MSILLKVPNQLNVDPPTLKKKKNPSISGDLEATNDTKERKANETQNNNATTNDKIDNEDENGEVESEKVTTVKDLEKQPTAIESKPPRESQSANKRCCKSLPARLCPYFPVCCDLKLHTSLQILVFADFLVAFMNLGIWVYFHQYDPFAINLQIISSNQTTVVNDDFDVKTTTLKNKVNLEEFHETTTNAYNKENFVFGAGDGNNVKYSKIGYAFRDFQQEVENSCGRQYYSDYLVGYSLTITAGVFADVLNLIYFTEILYQFCDVSILATICCFFEFTSGRLFLIIIWNLELVPVLVKLYLIVASRSHRLCIFQYGLGLAFRGQDALVILHFIPLIIFRAYIFIVFTYFVASMLEFGNLAHQTRIEGVTLLEYQERHAEYLRMSRNTNNSSSDDDEADYV